MVRSPSIVKMFASSLLNRRGYAIRCSSNKTTASIGGFWAASPDKGGYMAQNQEKDPGSEEGKSDTQPSWAPDPVTGFYKPCHSGPEIYPAEPRETVLNQPQGNQTTTNDK